MQMQWNRKKFKPIRQELRCFVFFPFDKPYFIVTCALTVSLGSERVPGWHEIMSLN